MVQIADWKSDCGCSNRSGGPRWGFICESHRKKLSKKAQQAARDAWRSKQSA